MKVNITPELKARQSLAEIAENAAPVLEHAIGSPAERVTATWDLRIDERGRPLLRLTIYDWSGQAFGDFAPEELQPPERSRRRFIRLWGDLLQRASEQAAEGLMQTLQADQGS